MRLLSQQPQHDVKVCTLPLGAQRCQYVKRELEQEERLKFASNFPLLRRQPRLKVIYLSSDFGQTVASPWLHSKRFTRLQVMLSFMADAIAMHGKVTSSQHVQITCLSLNGADEQTCCCSQQVLSYVSSESLPGRIHEGSAWRGLIQGSAVGLQVTEETTASHVTGPYRRWETRMTAKLQDGSTASK
eukprot:749497-Hanusia_phi.AAC.8